MALDRQVWQGHGPPIVGPTDGEQALPFAASHRDEVPHWHAELWVRGTYVEVQRARLEGERGDYRFERLRIDPHGRDILVYARAGGAAIADVTAYARP